MFLKQFTGFKAHKQKVKYGNSPIIYLLWLSGSVPIKYQMRDYTIPLNIILPENFPIGPPKVFIAFPLDPIHAKNNPFLRKQNEVMNNYIHKWDGNNNQYNLGGLCYNLSKSFGIHPPMGSASGGKLNTDVIHITDESKPLPKNVVHQECKINTEPQQIPEHAKVGKNNKVMDEKAQMEEIKRIDREDKLDKVKAKIKQRLDSLNSSIQGLEKWNDEEDLIAQSKKFLEDNSTKIKKQTLILDNDKAEMEEGIQHMKEFIAKNKDKDVNEVSTQPLMNSELTAFVV